MSSEAKRAYDRAYYVAHRDKMRGQMKAWREANADAVLARVTEWQKANPEKARANKTNWRKKHPEQHRACQQAWNRNNLAYLVAAAARYNARKKAASGSGVTPKQWQEILAASLGICAYCNQRRPLEMEHIEPLNKGGSHDTDNIAAACRSCNSSKNDTSLAIWLARLAIQLQG